MNEAFKKINDQIIKMLEVEQNREIQWINILHVFCIEVFVNFETKEEELEEKEVRTEPGPTSCLLLN